MNILLYGGSFNPIHISHLECLKKAINIHDFDKVLMIINYQAVHKDNTSLIDSKHRLKMLDLAIKEVGLNDIVEVSTIELESKQAMYTYDTVLKLKELYQDATFHFLIGYDQAYKLDSWYKIEELKKLVSFMIISGNNKINDLDDMIVIDGDVGQNRSTLIREQYQSTGFNSVDKYIRENGLYLEDYLINQLSTYRYQHSINVSKLAVKLARFYKEDETNAYIAGVLHDVCKELDISKQYEFAKKSNLLLLELNDKTVHAYAGGVFIKEVLNIDNEQVSSAISKHTTAHLTMSNLDKIIYVSDMLSLEREFDGVNELREIMYDGLDNVFNKCLIKTYDHLKGNDFSEEYQLMINKIKKRG